MGQTLSEPVVEKHTTSDADERIAYGASAMQGWRISMEDAHTTILKMDGSKSGKHVSFFAVYDGHGGQSVAKYSGAQLHEKIANDETYEKGNYTQAIKRGFLATDTDLRSDPDFQNDPSGCTAVAALITDDWRIFVGNAGDSRAVLSANGVAVPLSFDHKPVNPDESQRIIAAGGFVEFGRVNGNLALSRAIGDFEFKQNSNLPPEKQIVTANPDITERQLTETDEFVVIACDGIWDCMTNQDVVDFVRQKIADGLELGQISEAIMDHCLAPDSEPGGVGCDNMTVIIVGLLRGKSKEEWAAEIKAKVGETKRPEDEKTPINGVPEDASDERVDTLAEANTASDKI